VVFVNRYAHPDGSATSQLLSDLAAELSRRGWRVTMIASRQRYDDSRARLPATERWGEVEIARVATTRFGRATLAGRALDYLSFYLALPFALLPRLRRGDVVVAKTDPPLLGVVVAPVAWLRGARTVNWLQDLFPEVAVALGQPRLPRPAVSLLRALRNLALRASAMNVAIGEGMRRHLAAQGLAPAKLAVIANWSHENAIRPMAASDSRLRQRLGLADRFVVGYSGNLGRAHEWQPLLEAARALVDEPRIALLVGGGGHGYEALRREVASSGLGNIGFQPYHPLEFLSDSMAAADLHLVSLRPELEGLVLPSKFYGIAAAARPVAFIGDPGGELARLIVDEDCGFVVPTGRGDLLAQGIRAMAGDPLRARRQGNNARRLLEQRFSRAAAHEQWHHLLADVANGASRASNPTQHAENP
jgi:glycosyltransferase involved in cell wall biosynthesis